MTTFFTAKQANFLAAASSFALALEPAASYAASFFAAKQANLHIAAFSFAQALEPAASYAASFFAAKQADFFHHYLLVFLE